MYYQIHKHFKYVCGAYVGECPRVYRNIYWKTEIIYK